MHSLGLAKYAYEHAMVHYNDKGIRWDWVVECMTLEEMAGELEDKGITTKADAVLFYQEYALLMEDVANNQGCEY